MSRTWPTHDGRWGIRQLQRGEPTGAGTLGGGWATREEAEANNPPMGPYTFEAYERFPADRSDPLGHERQGKPFVIAGGSEGPVESRAPSTNASRASSDPGPT